MTDCSDPQCGVCRRRIEDPERDGVWVCSTCFDVPETIDGYVGRLKRALRGSITTRRRVAEEVRLHLEELAASETDAVDQVDAERRATQRMGSPETLAAELPYRRWKPWIVVAATILCGVAGICVLSPATDTVRVDVGRSVLTKSGHHRWEFDQRHRR